MDTIAHQSILILGLGESGLGAAELALFHGANVTILDANISDKLEERANRLINRGATVCLDWISQDWEKPVDLAIISPGIPADSKLGQLAASLSCPLISELEFAYHFCNCPILAVTGTNGKTTTVELVVHILKTAGKRTLAAANIGFPLSEAALKSASLDVIVAEVSSFQLEHIDKFSPLGAALLNISDDHLDRYPDRKAYLKTKLRLFSNITNPKRIVLNASLLERKEVQDSLPDHPSLPVAFGELSADDLRKTQASRSFYSHQKQICQDDGNGPVPVMPISDLKLQGQHNIENVCAALALAQMVGVAPSEAVPAIRKFAPSAHRFELVAVHDGVKYINDSKATNPDALIQAIRTSQATHLRRNGKIILIAGGRDKKMDFTPVIPYLAASVKEVYVIGESREDLSQAWSPHVPCMMLSSLAACVQSAIENATGGDVVLLSPGCASQDMFSSYVERGTIFSQEVRRRLGE